MRFLKLDNLNISYLEPLKKISAKNAIKHLRTSSRGYR